jgi:hypothetical protein
MESPEQAQERGHREQQVLLGLRVVADRLDTAAAERIVAIAAAHHVGVSVRTIAAAVRLSPARVHQLLHTPEAQTLGAWSRSSADPERPLAATASRLRECVDWLDRLEQGGLVAVNLREGTDPETEYVPVDRRQVRQVLHRIARDLEDVAAGQAVGADHPPDARRERLADLQPPPPPLNSLEERRQRRRRLGMDL